MTFPYIESSEKGIAWGKADELIDYFSKHFPKAYLKIEARFHEGSNYTMIKEREPLK